MDRPFPRFHGSPRGKLVHLVDVNTPRNKADKPHDPFFHSRQHEHSRFIRGRNDLLAFPARPPQRECSGFEIPSQMKYRSAFFSQNRSSRTRSEARHLVEFLCRMEKSFLVRHESRKPFFEFYSADAIKKRHQGFRNTNKIAWRTSRPIKHHVFFGTLKINNHIAVVYILLVSFFGFFSSFDTN